MTARLVALCFHASDPLNLARFWTEALGWEIEGEAAVEVALLPTYHRRFRVFFFPAPTEKAGKNRIHPDLFRRPGGDVPPENPFLAGCGRH